MDKMRMPLSLGRLANPQGLIRKEQKTKWQGRNFFFFFTCGPNWTQPYIGYIPVPIGLYLL